MAHFDEISDRILLVMDVLFLSLLAISNTKITENYWGFFYRYFFFGQNAV